MPLRSPKSARKGATSVEFAIVSPVVLLIVMGSVMFSWGVMTQNTLTAAAHEGCRVGSLESVDTSTPIVSAVQDRLQRGGLDPGKCTVTCSPSDMSNMNSGDQVSVSITLPLGQYKAFQWGDWLENTTLGAEITYLRE